MNTRSVRFRISVWYTTIFSIAMAVLFIVFYTLTQQSLLSHTDFEITSDSQSIVELISQGDASLMDTSFANNSLTFAQKFSEMPGMVLIVGDPLGKIIYTSQRLGTNEKVIQELLEKSANIIRPTFVNRSIGASAVRLGIFPATRNSQVQAIVIMGQPMNVIQTSLNTLALTLLGIYFGVFLLSLLGGYILAGRAMNPVAEISHQLKKIGAENLNDRMPNPKTGDELEELSKTFNGLLDNLHDAFIRERQFIGDMAHELKTPLATLKSSIEVTLNKARTNDDYKNAYADTLVDVNRLTQTVKNILDLAWIGAENAHTLKGSVDLSRITADLREIAEKLAMEKRIAVKATIVSGVVVEGAEDKVFRALLNIIDNAIKYTPVGKTVSLSLKVNRHHAFFVVKDTGIGISSDEQAHMFERFYRGSKTSRTVGSGLGLAIAHGIIHAHHGDIQVSSKLGQGTIITVVLPLTKS